MFEYATTFLGWRTRSKRNLIILMKIKVPLSVIWISFLFFLLNSQHVYSIDFMKLLVGHVMLSGQVHGKQFGNRGGGGGGHPDLSRILGGQVLPYFFNNQKKRCQHSFNQLLPCFGACFMHVFSISLGFTPWNPAFFKTLYLAILLGGGMPPCPLYPYGLAGHTWTYKRSWFQRSSA